MKRFVVLCSVLALVSLFVPMTWATAPAISDLPDVRLLSGGGGPPKGVISSGLNTQELDAYNVEAMIKDFDDAIGDLILGVTGTTMIDPPPPPLPDIGGAPPDIELDAGNNIDVYGIPGTGWARYTVTADDGENPVSEWKAIAKYSTFAMGTPSLSEGRFFNLTKDGWQFAYVSMGGPIEVEALDSTISPPTAVDWTAYMNNIEYLFDPNGNLLGVNPAYILHGSSFTANGWDVSISLSGGLMMTPNEPFSPGPFLVGILATNQVDPNDIDATRVLVSAGMLGLSTPGGHDPATAEKSETLDGLTPGPVPTPKDPDSGPDFKVPIQEGSHWGYHLMGEERINTAAPMAIVDLLTDPDLPPAADPELMKGVIAAPGIAMIATGNALKATFPAGVVTRRRSVSCLVSSRAWR